MNAEIAGQLIAKFVEKTWPNDKREVWDILRLGINKAWDEGKWYGMTAEFTAPIYKDGSGQSYFMAPPSHPILQAINTQSMGSIIRDPYFMFHRNGYGDIKNRGGCDWNKDVYDMGEVPYFDRNNINFSEGIRIGVRSLGNPGSEEKVIISGSYANDEKVYTYKKSDMGSCLGCPSKESIETVNGIEIEIGSGFNYINNVCFNSISSITKTITKTPVEIIALDQAGVGHRIALMQPNQKFSTYRKYLVPTDLCGKNSIHGIFKIAPQEVITSMSDNIIISSDEALISLAKGVYNMYYKDQTEAGSQFFLMGIGSLEKQKRETASPSESPIQVLGIYDDDIPRVMKYHS